MPDVQRFLGFSSTAALRLSWFNGEGAREMDVDELYTIWLNVTASYKLRGKTSLVFGVTPQISTDFDTWTTHNLFSAAMPFSQVP